MNKDVIKLILVDFAIGSFFLYLFILTICTLLILLYYKIRYPNMCRQIWYKGSREIVPQKGKEENFQRMLDTFEKTKAKIVIISIVADIIILLYQNLKK